MKIPFLSGRKTTEAKTETSLMNIYDDTIFRQNIAAKGDFVRTQRERINLIKQLAVVAACTEARTTDIVKQELAFYRDGKKVNNTAIPKKARTVISGTWNLTNRQLLAMTCRHLILTGEYLWVIRYKNELERFDGIPGIDPYARDQYTVYLDETGRYPASFEINTPKLRFTVKASECIYFTAGNMYIETGIGDADHGKYSVEDAMLYSDFKKDFLQNGSFPSWLLIEDSKISASPKEMQARNSMMQSRFAGVRGNPGFIQSTDAKIIQMQQDLNGIMLNEASKTNAVEIMTAFKVPAERLFITRDGKTENQNALNIYYNTVVNFDMQMLAETIQYQYIRKIDPSLELKFAPYAYDQVDDLIKLIEHGVITPKRAAERLDEKPTGDKLQDKLYMAVNIAPIDALLQEANVSKTAMQAPTECLAPKKSKQFVSVIQTVRNTSASKYVPNYLALFKKQQKHILDLISSNLALDDVLVDIDFGIFDEEYKRILKSEHTSSVQRTISAVNAEYRANIDSSINNPEVSFIINALQTRYLEFDYNQAIRAHLTRIMQDAIEDSWNLTEIEDALVRSGVFSEDRAWQIARTEAQVASDKATIMTYRKLGVKFVDVVGCTQFETYSDCGRSRVPIEDANSLTFHPNHLGVIVASNL